ncbi:MAG: L,D-transpeptidase family protein [Pseudomonadota bacterium]
MSAKKIFTVLLAVSVAMPTAGFASPLGGLKLPAVDTSQHLVLVSDSEERKRRRERRKQRQEKRARIAVAPSTQQAQSRPVAPIRKIRGPQFLNYQVAALQNVPLAALIPDMASTGSITAATLAAQSTPITLPPMVVLDGSAPPIAGVKTKTAEAVEQAEVALPEMTLLGDQPPSFEQAPSVPEMTVLEAAPVRLASTDLFELAAQAPVDGSIMVEADIADALRELYAERRDFIWSDGHTINENANALLAELGDAQSHGLNNAHYAVSMPDLLDAPVERARQLIAFDVAVTARAVRYALDMKNGSIEPNKISGYHDFGKERLVAAEAAAALATALDVDSWFDSITPQQGEYRTLQAELASLRGETDNILPIPSKILLRPGDMNEALPAVMQGMERRMSAETREKHLDVLNAYAGGTDYNDGLVELVKDVQRDLNLKPDGIVGPMTASRLASQSVASKVERLEMALERLRWHPEAYGERQVVINAPEYRVRYKENGETKLAMRAIVGKKSNQTYFFHDEIEHVVFNPYWGVPQSIIVNSYLPKLRADPSYLDRNGFVVTTQSGRQVSSSSINWAQYGGKVPFNVRQKPGPRNALGELKIMFPNRHAIYMHDTPARNLFSRDARALSHGCVRLQDPRAMAAAVLGKSVGYVESQLGGYEKTEKMSATIPVWVGYFTAWPDDDGKVQYHADIYDRDEHLKKAMEKVAAARAV